MSMNIKTQVITSLIASILASVLAIVVSITENKVSRNKHIVKMTIVVFLSVLVSLFFMNKNDIVSQTIHTGTPNF